MHGKGTVNKIFNRILNSIKTKKNCILHFEKTIRCQSLHENHLTGNQYKEIVKIDEAWIYLNGCNKK